ncbi:pentapeptide repeat-containing protein [Piscirickettsia salmonis]|uniref:pentapeptide repeat-containing protein n=1 Tax=Piscirickettsia salmonis TaxID=1238 RepID=UPI0007C92A13|nr:Secreted effector protein pipB2 [Piscirickettsiaceae bacterium NZ-RLO1]
MKQTRQDVIREINKAYGPRGSGQLNLSGWDLSGQDLSGLYLYRANLQDANLQGANLSHSYLKEANLQNTQLQQANLSSSYLNNAVLLKADVTNANFSCASLFRATLSNIRSFGGAQFERTYIVDAEFKGADLKQTNIDLAIFRRGDFPYSTKHNLSVTGYNRTSGFLTYDQMFENAALPADCQLVKNLLSKELKETKKTKSQPSSSSATQKGSSNYNTLFEDQPKLDDTQEDYKTAARILTYSVLDQNGICTFANHLKVAEHSEQFYSSCRPLTCFGLHLQPNYVQKLFNDPQQSRTIKIILEEGLNKAITVCLKNGIAKTL